MNTSRVGDESEAVALSELMSLGFSVSVPFGDNDRYDLLVDDGEIHRVQVKTARIVNGAVAFKCFSSTTVNGEDKRTEYTENEVDAFVVYSPDKDKLYWVPIEETGSSEMFLRFEGNLSHSRVNVAKDYLLTERFK